MQPLPSKLLEGDPLSPASTDLIVQRAMLEVGEPVPAGGWRVLSGNDRFSIIARVVYRAEIGR